MKIKIGSLMLMIAFISGCNMFQKDENGNRIASYMVAAAAINANRGGGSGREMYTGFAEIPSSMTNSSSTFVEGYENVTSDYHFASTKYSVPKVYDRVRAYAKAIQFNTKQIGDLVSVLESVQVTGTTSNPQTGSDLTWLGQASSKYRYQPSSVLPGGKKLEVWWTSSAATPYTSNKAIELNYVGSTSSGNFSGFAFVRIPFVPPITETAATNTTLNTAGIVNSTVPATVTALASAYINFTYNSTTKTRTTIVIFQGIPGLAGTTFTDRAHFYIQEVDGVTTMDGTYTVSDYDPNTVATTMANINNASGTTATAVTLTSVVAAGRAYSFSAVGDSKRAIYRSALPILTPGTAPTIADVTVTGIYSNTSVSAGTCVSATTTGLTTPKCVPGLANLGQVWTNFLLTDATTVADLITVGGVCGATFIMTPAVAGSTAGNPLDFTSVTTTGTLKTCFDEILLSGQGSIASKVQDLYFLSNIKNPSYFKVSGTSSGLYGVENIKSSDGDNVSYSKLESNLNFLNSMRTTANPTYSANFDPYNVSQMNLFNKTSTIPQGTSATSLTNLNAMWGDGTTITTGVSDATAKSNFINGSIDDVAPF